MVDWYDFLPSVSLKTTGLTISAPTATTANFLPSVSNIDCPLSLDTLLDDADMGPGGSSQPGSPRSLGNVSLSPSGIPRARARSVSNASTVMSKIDIDRLVVMKMI